MSPARRTSLVAGALYLITFVSIPTLTLYGTAREKDFIISSASSTGVLWGCLLEVIVAVAGIGTAVTLFPVIRRQNEGLALGLIATRTLEAAMIFAGVASLLSLVALRQAGASGAQATSLSGLGEALIAFYNAMFLLGQSLMPVLNALLLGTLMYRSGLVPRAIPLIGLIGAPLQFTGVMLTLFGVVDRVSTVTKILVIPIAVWEFSLGVYLLVKGFKPSPLTAPRPPAAEAPVPLPSPETPAPSGGVASTAQAMGPARDHGQQEPGGLFPKGRQVEPLSGSSPGRTRYGTRRRPT